MIDGIIALAAGFAVFPARRGRALLGIIIATISIVVNFTFIPLAPWWALTIILIGLWINPSLFVHGAYATEPDHVGPVVPMRMGLLATQPGLAA